MARDRPGLGRWTSGLLAVAFAWSGALLAAAVMVPVYASESSTTSASASGRVATVTHTASSSSLVQANEPWVLIVVGVPLLVTAFVALALRRRRLTASRASGYAAWTSIGVLACLCVLAILSVGVFVAPVAVLLAVATAHTRPRAAPAAA